MIGAEVCLVREMSSLKTVVVAPSLSLFTPIPSLTLPLPLQAQTDCVLGVISYQDLERIDTMVPMTLRTLESNVKYFLLEDMINTVPILQ
jgi:hypothetical protein